MLRRQSAKSKSDLHRRGSASPVHGVQLEHLNASVAQRDATAAACQAFTRAAHERSSADQSLFPPPLKPSPRRSQTDNTGLNKYGQHHFHRSHENHEELRNQQSVRFIRPGSGPNRDFNPPRPAHHVRSGAVSAVEDPFHVPDQYDISDTDCPILKVPIHQLDIKLPQPHRKPPPVPVLGFSHGYFNALAPEEESYTPEDGIASSPSSYRRIRRSRSMLTTVTRGQQGEMLPPSSGPPMAKRLPVSLSCRFLNPDTNKENIQPARSHVLRAPKSMSYLRSRRSGNDSYTTSQEFPDEKVHLHEPSEDLAPAKSSFLFGSRGRNKELRKSLRRTSVNNVFTSLGVPSALNPSKDDGVKNKARKASKSWKVKLKGLFGLSKSEDGIMSLPNQHISSSKTRVSGSYGSIMSQDNPDVYGGNGEGSLRKVSSKLPSLHAVPSNQSLRSRKGSLENDERKVSDDKSLTSWTQSGPSTLTSQQQQEWKEWEKQRLSIIRENGTHAPSPSLSRPGLEMPTANSQTNTISQPAPPGPIVDSQRVYSALMKRLQGTRQTVQAVEQPRRSSEERIGISKSIPSIGPPSLKEQKISPTIRCVIPEDCQNLSASLHRERRLNSRPEYHVFDPFSEPESNLPVAFRNDQREARKLLSPPTHLLPPTGDLEPSARTRVDRPSAFFGSPTSHLFRTTSPYRRALQKSIEEEEKSMQGRGPTVDSTSESGTEIIRKKTGEGILKDGSIAGQGVAYTESVYSQGSEDRGKRSVSFADDGPSTLDDVTMNPDPPVTYRPTGHRVNSSVSSIDWKTWLSANVAKLEPLSPSTKPSEVKYILPSMPNSVTQGHVQEAAQTHEDDDSTSDFNDSPPTRKPTLPTTPLSTVEPNVLKTSPFLRSVKRTTPPPSAAACPLSENEDYRTPPPIPMRSLLRPTPSPAKNTGRPVPGNLMSPFSVGYSVTSSPGLSMAVQRQFGPTSLGAGLSGDLTNISGRVKEVASPGSAPGLSHVYQDSPNFCSTDHRQATVVADKSSLAFL